MLNEKELEEVKLNAIGKQILAYSGIGFSIFSIIALMSDANLAWAVLLVLTIGVTIGISMCLLFRSEKQIIKSKKEAESRAAEQFLHIVNNDFDAPFLHEDTKKSNSGTKEIVKDAIIGGVIAGPAGAVVGAIVGKEKADNKK